MRTIEKVPNTFKYFLVFLITLYGLEVFVFWPGLLRPDSLGQLAQAQIGVFSDHHPPIMALYWRVLNFIYPGPGLLFLTHITLLFLSSFFFAISFRESSWCWFYGAILLWPQVFFYSTFVLKDMGFTFAFLCTASLLTLYSLRKTPLPFSLVLMICVLLFYGTAVKFQAVFVLPIVALWLSYCLSGAEFSFKTFVRGALIFAFLFGSVHVFNSVMVEKKDYSWQFVKIYDLVGIGLREDKDLLPDFVKNGSFFSPGSVEEKYSAEKVDPLVFDVNPPLIKGKTAEERESLWSCWFEAVLEYPHAYFSHRWALFKNLLNKSPIKGLSTMASHHEYIPPLAKHILVVCDAWGIIHFFEKMSAFKFYLPFAIVYLFFGLFRVRTDVYALPLLFLNAMGLMLLGTLFFFSMASDARYIYLTVCCFHFSHPFFFRVIKNMRNRQIL